MLNYTIFAQEKELSQSILEKYYLLDPSLFTFIP